jgi:hypothetical protein
MINILNDTQVNHEGTVIHFPSQQAMLGWLANNTSQAGAEQSEAEPSQCLRYTVKGPQCKNRATNGHFCHLHQSTSGAQPKKHPGHPESRLTVDQLRDWLKSNVNGKVRFTQGLTWKARKASKINSVIWTGRQLIKQGRKNSGTATYYGPKGTLKINYRTGEAVNSPAS